VPRGRRWWCRCRWCRDWACGRREVTRKYSA